MGNEIPIKTKTTNDGIIYNNIRYGMSIMQGYKKKITVNNISDMNLLPSKNIYIFGIFDGENGTEIPKYLSQNFSKNLLENTNFKNGKYKEALIETFEEMDSLLITDKINKELINNSQKSLKDKGSLNLTMNETNNINTFIKLFNPINLEKTKIAEYEGCSGIVILYTENNTYIAYAGNSRFIIFDKNNNINKKIQIFEQNLKNKTEKNRVEIAFGCMGDGGINIKEEMNKLDCTRGFGFFKYKNNKLLKNNEQIIISTPNIVEIPNSEIGMMIIGNKGFFQCNGIGQYFKEKIKIQGNKNISECINEFFDKNIDSKENTKLLFNKNLSCIVIDYSV